MVPETPKKYRFYWHFHLNVFSFWLVPKTASVSACRSSPSTNEVPLRCTCLGGERPLEPAAQLLELEGWPKSLEETKIQNIQTYLQLWPMQHGCWFPKKQILISHVFTWDCAWSCCGKSMMKRRVCFSSKFSTYILITMAFFVGVIALSQIVRSTSALKPRHWSGILPHIARGNPSFNCCFWWCGTFGPLGHVQPEVALHVVLRRSSKLMKPDEFAQFSAVLCFISSHFKEKMHFIVVLELETCEDSYNIITGMG